MQPTIEILERVKQNSEKNKDEIFTRLYRYMLRPDLYFIAYKNLYANKGASTKGVDDDTADGFSKDKVDRIIKKLTDESYTPNPSRRTYIKKSNGKMRPLGIPTFTDKLVQEVLRMILESVYEPMFLDCSHGFRPNRSCHTALKDLKHQFHGTRWFVEGDIKGCFDNIDHHVLVNVVNTKIKDARIIKLIWKLLKAGYIDDWQYHNTYSGTPQGGIISPLFANIYLHELDKFVVKLAQDFDRPRTQMYTDEYDLLQRKVKSLSARAGRADGEKKQQLLEERKIAKAELLKTPSKSQTDKKIKYFRYADDFIIGVNGSKDDCVQIKKQLSEFIANTLKMELSDEKTLITHSNNYARFLGYDVRVRRDNRTITNGGTSGFTKRTLNNMTEIVVPLEDKIMRFLFDRGAVVQKNGVIKPMHRKSLLRCTDLEIVSSYNAELRGVCNYYSMASNFYKLQYFAYLMEYSCLKTLANRHKTRVPKIMEMYKDGKGKWGIPYENKSGEKRCYFAAYMDCKKAKNVSDSRPQDTSMHCNSITSFDSRLSAKKCELCGTTEAEHYEIHHVHKVKDLEGKEQWERVMIAKNRKTMVLCKECHYKIHGRVLTN
jgi:group II intron reverse transcriptase/maturase